MSRRNTKEIARTSYTQNPSGPGMEGKKLFYKFTNDVMDGPLYLESLN